MPVTVRTSSVLRGLLQGNLEVESEGKTVREVLTSLGVLERICDPSGGIRRHFNIHVNDGDDIRLGRGLETKVKSGDVVTILSAISGGAEYRRKVWLTFPKEQVARPLVWEVGQRFEVVTNIRQASVSSEIGIVGLEITGEREEVMRAVDFLEEQGVSVEPIELDVVE